ncbi:hypothetical protein [Streptomyces sp. Ac-502]|uniref:hypothetical protein n=1 Tax=Streptomyces sp. Ac-502 TaxID=3342801 RepID=UPI003862894D
MLSHNAPPKPGGFRLRGVTVVPADRLVPWLLANVGAPDPVRAQRVLEPSGRALRRYVKWAEAAARLCGAAYGESRPAGFGGPG